MSARLAIVALIGGVIGFFAETIHRKAGVWILTGGSDLPWWIAIVYALGLFGAGLVFRSIDARLGVPRPSTRALAIEASIFVVLFLAPPLFHAHEIPLTIATIVYAALRLAIHRTKGDVLVAAFVVIADLVIELSLIALGLFRYTNADYTVVPLWLSQLWIGLGLSLRRLLIGASR